MQSAISKDFILSRISKSKISHCWNWVRGKDGNGYARARDGKKSSISISRKAYQLWVGKIPKGLLVLHRCDNPACVNPNHLFVGTYQDNYDDMVRKGRARVGNRKFTEIQVRAIRNDTRKLKVIADDYDSHLCTIWFIRSRRTYKSVP